MSINILPEDIVNTIAAGEVIERPSSIVKELLENSIDAKANSITVSLLNGGINSITITDNGIGMTKEDLQNCIIRHATSKLFQKDDLFSISTLGFRGEALASVAAIAELKITSKTKEQREANTIIVEKGIITKSFPTGAIDGTTIEVKDIFSYQPVRRQYLRSSQQEFTSIQEVIMEYALIHPDKHFKLIHNNQERLNSPPSTQEDTILHLFGKDIARNLIPISFSFEEININGWVTKPQYTRSDKQYIHTFINHRYVKSNLIINALLDAYHRLLHGNRYPFALLSIELDPSTIDVNVHPQKSEIRFSSENLIQTAVKNAINSTLQENDLIPSAPISEASVNQVRDNIQPPIASKTQSFSEQQSTLASSEFELQHNEKPSILIHGIIRKCFIIAEDKEGLMIIDQHACDERVNYESLCKQFEDKGISEEQQKAIDEMLRLVSHTPPEQHPEHTDVTGVSTDEKTTDPVQEEVE